MRKISVYRCPECRKPFRTLGAWANHMNNAHPEVRPKGYSDRRFFYYNLTGKTHGNCIVCKKETEWNEETSKYNRFCSNLKCKEEYRNMFKERMISKYGKVTMMDDPEFARKALANRRISGKYRFSDGGEVNYVGSYEKDFLIMMDKFLGYKSTDIMAPSPHTYYYEYEGEKHYYIPDFFIPNLNLEIEIKQNESTHPKILAVDKVKEQKKDEVMISNKAISYIKLVDKKYEPFIEYLLSLKERIPEKDIDQPEVVKYKLAQEAVYGDTDSKYQKYSSILESIIQSELEKESSFESYCSIDIKKYDSMMALYKNIPEKEDDEELVIEGINENYFSNPFLMPLLIIGAPIAISYISYKGEQWWNTKVRPTVEYNKWKSLFVSVKRKGDTYTIKGIDYYDLANRINETFESDKLKKLFSPNYKKFSEFLFKKKQIRRADMEVKSISFPAFFCVELQELFAELGEAYNDFCYRKIARLIYENSWLSKADKLDIPLLNTDALKDHLNEKYELLPHQKKFIELWDVLKGRLNLRGYILAFGQGLGKTLTATSLSILKNKKKVYIVCPNTLTVNWAEELKLYLKKYSDINLWREEVGIVGNPKYPVGPKCKYLICNNEALDKLLPLINISGESTMLVVDESQNFRNYNGLRVKQLLDAAKKIKSGDILLCSGTPIKAVPNEIVPSLMLIDPLMTDEVAHTYHLAFNIDNTLAAQIVNRRFGMIMYRKTKEELDLPPREVHDFPLQITNPDPYLLSTTSEKVNERFMIYYKEKLEKNDELKEKYQSYVEKYHRAPADQYRLYLKKFINTANTDKREFLHELDRIKIEGFVEQYVRPYIPEEHKKEFEKLYTDFVMMKQSAMGKSIGEILPPLRAELYTKMFMENQEKILDMIDERTKKTVIFSMFLPVVNEIDRLINQSGRFKSVKITGSVKDRKAIIDRFKQDPSVKVLVATSQTLGTGVTLTEASLMFFFGPPWRETDFEQCADRIHRIGQVSKVDIYNAILLDSRPNLSSRMTDIMKWSGDMFGSMIKTTDETELYNGVAQEGYLLDDKTVNYRVDEFKNGKENILFIAGLSGSGKTTLSREIGKDENVEIIALDDMMIPGLFSDENLKEYHPLIYKFFTSTAIGKSHRANKEYTEDMVLNVLPAFIQFISNNSTSQKFVIEGFYFVNDKFFSKVKNIVKRHSIMILGTSMIKSFYRRMKRNSKYQESSRHKRSELILNALQNDLHWQNGLNKLIKEVRSWNKSIAQEAVAGSFIDTRPYDNPIPTPAPEPEYVPQNIIPSKNEIGPGALLKSDNVVKAMIPCVMDEISGEPSDGTKPVNLPVEKINMDQNPDPNGDVKITEREKAVERVNAILTRFDQYSILSRKKYLNELKSLILRWNVDVDLSKYPKVRKLLLDMNSPATEVYTPGYIFDYYGTPFPGTQTYAMEGKIENPDDLHPVYILLTHSSTLFSNTIKKFTGDKYTHAAICFDHTFKKLYTFGRKKIGGGFSIESPNSEFYKKKPDIPYGIYCVFVTSEQLKEMKKRLQVFIDNEDRYKYHFSGLVKFIFGKESENDTRYFCSGFVVDILQAGGLSKARSYSLYKPQDLTHLYSSYKIDSGNGLQNINQDRILTNTNIAKNKYIQRFYKK